MRREWGLTYEDLAAINRLIYASLTAYGEQGPERQRRFDLVAYWARSGLMTRSALSAAGSALPGMGDHPTAVTLVRRF